MTSGNTLPSADLLRTRRHFPALDGLRGIAALSVVLFHFMEMAIPDYSKLFIGHGYLAVDFFFCLSGFVIAYAYDDRIRVMGLAEFAKARLIRLYPLILFGSVLGLIAFLFDPFHANQHTYTPTRLGLFFLASILLIPFSGMVQRAGNFFGLNAPAWSLFWEAIANLVYAFVLSRLSRRWLVACLAVAAVVLGFVAWSAGTLSGGWGGDTFWHGGARVAYSFLAGLLVYRASWILRSRLGFVGLSILLVATFLMPVWPWNWLAELLIVLLYFPWLIALGAGATLSPQSTRLCLAAGRLSYPLYMTHYAVIWIFAGYYNAFHPATPRLALIVTSGVLLTAAFAWLVLLVYDTPVRRYLTATWRARGATLPEASSATAH